LESRLQHIRTAAGARYEHLGLHALVQRVEVTEHRHIAAEDLAHQWPQLPAFCAMKEDSHWG
jgi:hypothetical protein